MLEKHLLPRLGDMALSEITRQEVQVYVAHLVQEGYAPKSIDHIHDVLSAVLRTAVKWGHLPDNPARGVELPTLKTVRPKWALTPDQASALLGKLPPLGRAMVGLAIVSGLRRGELFALRWRDIDEHERVLTVREAVYDGTFGTPKTEAGLRQIPLSEVALQLISEWKQRAGKTTLARDGLARSGREHERVPITSCDGPSSPSARRWSFPTRLGSRSGGHTRRGRTTGCAGQGRRQTDGAHEADVTLNV